MTRHVSLLVSLLGFSSVLGCGATGAGRRDAGDGDVVNECSPGGPQFVCNGNLAIACNADETEGASTDCGASGEVCTPGSGCVTCRPYTFRCSGDNIESCNADGSGWSAHSTCDSSAGEVCNAFLGNCRNACADAERDESYIGCEYWPTPIANAVNAEFDYAVVVANPQPIAATVTITRAGSEVSTVTIPSGGLETIRLPWVAELKNAGIVEGTAPDQRFRPRSALVRGGAYRLRSNVPVSVYQFSPLEYRLERDCAQEEPGKPLTDGRCHSFSNDASLLLPTHVLTGNYIAVAERTQQTHETVTIVDPPPTQEVANRYQSVPGVLGIVGASESPVTLSVTLTAHVAVSVDGTSVSAGSPGETLTFTLGAGDVLQLATAEPPDSCTVDDTIMRDDTGLFCEECGAAGCVDIECTLRQVQEFCRVPDEYDLTGTVISASGPVMVLGGHFCAFKPHTRFACDHLEESIFPLETWGDDFIVTTTQPLRSEPNIVRVVSGADTNEITFDPPSVHTPVTLNRGGAIEFETAADFRVRGSAGAILVAQFLVGQDYAGPGTAGPAGLGDPSLSFAIPTAQFRTSYTVLTPLTYERNFINVTAPVGAEVTLSTNGGAPTPVTGWQPIGTTGMQRARVEVPGGTHTLNSAERFGVVVYGFGSYTSYMYPGGLDFVDINPLI